MGLLTAVIGYLMTQLTLTRSENERTVRARRGRVLVFPRRRLRSPRRASEDRASWVLVH